MNSLLENQKIGKRRYSTGGTAVPPRISNKAAGRGTEKPAFRPAGIVSLFEKNSKLINNIRQEPFRGGSRKKRASPPKPRKMPVYVSDAETENPHSENSEQRREETRPAKKRSLSFSFPAVPAAALLLLVLGSFFVIYEREQSGALDWMDREVVPGGKDSGSSYNLSLYAGLASAENPERTDGQIGIPLDLTETFEWKSYKVKRGDSVSKIAADFSLSMDAVIASNGITNARALREGEVLRIPNMDGIPYTVKSGDSLTLISKSLGVPLEAILDANDIQSDNISAGTGLFIPGARMKREDLKMALGELFIYPLKGARLTSPFGWRDDPFTGVRRYHAALDLAAPQGTPVKAAMDGKVSAAGFDKNLGNFVIISHSGGFQTTYAHLYTASVRKGDAVRQGAQIGLVGSTGYSTGPHLHFVVFKNGRAVNPLDFLNPRR